MADWPEMTVRTTALIAHLVKTVQEHQEKYGDPDADGDFSLSWEPEGWWLSIVCPGHYAFERDSQPDVNALVLEAARYYGGSVTLWDGERGCREHHPHSAMEDR